ncbi:MAG: hypothetical protein M2R45_00761 [Verrucomicrobia subdivision 3 bacterium]|nr:hypothetical protein [Limisphaerales bacterium]MCS1413133.1 hypothetical protein [Limisphaerales bacterium]
MSLQATVLVISLPFLIYRGRRFLCSTAWAKKQGITPDEFRRFRGASFEGLGAGIALIIRNWESVIFGILRLIVTVLLIGAWLSAVPVRSEG